MNSTSGSKSGIRGVAEGDGCLIHVSNCVRMHQTDTNPDHFDEGLGEHLRLLEVLLGDVGGFAMGQTNLLTESCCDGSFGRR